MTNRFSFKIIAEKELALIVSFLSAYLLYWWFGNYDFRLNIPDELYISNATLNGQDVGKRIRFFYQALISGIFLCSVIYFILYKLKSFFQYNSHALEPASLVALTGSFLIIADIFGVESSKAVNLFISLLFLTLIFSFFSKSTKKVFRLAASVSFITTILTLAFLILSSFLFLFNSNAEALENSVLIYCIISIILGSIVLLGKHITKISYRKIAGFFLPLALIPVFIFISVESLLYFKIKQDFFISYKWLFIGFTILSFIAFYFYNLKRQKKLSVTKTLAYFYTPAAILAFILLTRYEPLQKESQDIFEMANPVNAMMRIFSFDEIPLVDFMTSHMFAEQFYGMLYILLFGYDGSLDFMAYSFLSFVVFFGIAYYFFLRLFKQPSLALLFLVAFPFLYMFCNLNVFYSILLFFATHKLMQKTSTGNYLLLYTIVLCLIIWALDVGSATLLTAVIFLPLSFFTERKKIVLSPVIKSLVIFLLIISGLVITAIYLRSPEYIWENFKSALHYISANQAHGYSSVTENFNQQFYFYHVLIPLISALGIFRIIYILRNKANAPTEENRYILTMSMFFYLICLANFQRGLVRHSFFEGSEYYLASTFFIATALFLLPFLKEENRSGKYVFFFSLSFLLIVSLKYFPMSKEKTDLERLLTGISLKDLDHTIHDNSLQGRTMVNKEFANENYIELKCFLDKNLSKDQTFLDFSNSPLLYYYCQRKVPSYFCQSQQNMVDDFLQLQQLKRINPEQVPVVLYSNYPTGWFDETDGVPNVMRQYMIAEYIFQNYRPFAVMSKRSLWINKSKNYKWEILKTDSLPYLPKMYNYKKAACFINRYFENKKYDQLTLAGASEPDSDSIHSGLYTVSLKDEINTLPGIFAKIVISNPLEGQEIKVQIADDLGITGSFLFETTAKDTAYMLRLSNHYLWHIRPTKYIIMNEVNNSRITRIEFYKDNRF